MSNNLSQEQLLLLQQHLTYEVFENFMGLFETDEDIPSDDDERKAYFIKIMKEHHYFGEIQGWGKTRVWVRIPKDIRFDTHPFIQKKSQFINLLDDCAKRKIDHNGDPPFARDCLSVTEDDDLLIH
jgi:hypothetical protein